jgi:hypothetical protein
VFIYTQSHLRNTIEFAGNGLKPPVDGWITSFKPNLTYENGAQLGNLWQEGYFEDLPEPQTPVRTTEDSE